MREAIMVCSSEMSEKAKKLAQETLVWVKTDEGQRALQEAVSQAERVCNELAIARRVSPEQLCREFDI